MINAFAWGGPDALPHLGVLSRAAWRQLPCAFSGLP